MDIPKYSIREQFMIPRIARRDRLDVLHVPFYVVPVFYTGRLVVTIYDLEQLLFPYCSPPWPGQIIVRSMMHLAVRKADYLIAISDHTKKDIIRMMGAPAEKIEAIHLACAPAFLRSVSREGWGGLCKRFGIREPFVMTITGKQWKLKNAIGALRGFLKAKNAAKLPHQMVVVGTMGREGELALTKEVPPEHRDAVILAGFVSDEELASLYSATELFVFASRYEGFGFPPLEAMACGAPTIASMRASIPEVLGTAALYADPDDPDAMAACIVRVLQDSQLRSRLSALGRARAESFSWMDTAKKTAQVYWKAARCAADRNTGVPVQDEMN